uniref:Endoplasmic reticulum transmembrane protein n=1 Tax=Noctiluca scintillans TaxID=2966 RepID=A0A7S1A278_NOCSC
MAEADALHFLYRLGNNVDYALIGFLVLLLLLNSFTPVSKVTNSFMGKALMLGLTGYFYLRWQVDISSIPMKSEDAGDAEKVAFYRATRDVFLEFSGLVLALFNFTVSYLRGEIASLREQLEKSGKSS